MMTLDKIIEYLTQNKQWLFSGAGVAVAAGLCGLIRWLILSVRRQRSVDKGDPTQARPYPGVTVSYFLADGNRVAVVEGFLAFLCSRGGRPC